MLTLVSLFAIGGSVGYAMGCWSTLCAGYALPGATSSAVDTMSVRIKLQRNETKSTVNCILDHFEHMIYCTMTAIPVHCNN